MRRIGGIGFGVVGLSGCGIEWGLGVGSDLIVDVGIEFGGDGDGG